MNGKRSAGRVGYSTASSRNSSFVVAALIQNAQRKKFHITTTYRNVAHEEGVLSPSRARSGDPHDGHLRTHFFGSADAIDAGGLDGAPT